MPLVQQTPGHDSEDKMTKFPVNKNTVMAGLLPLYMGLLAAVHHAAEDTEASHQITTQPQQTSESYVKSPDTSDKTPVIIVALER